MKIKKTLYAFLLFTTAFAGCEKESTHDAAAEKPRVDKIEIGLNNNEMGVIGRDFHFNAEITAGSKIESVIIRIQPKAGESYPKPWRHEIVWNEYKDAKNATVHKHFDVPADAVEGVYDFLIIVNDQNGSVLEVKREIALFTAANLPVDPGFTTVNIFTYIFSKGPYYDGKEFTKPGVILVKNEMMKAFVKLSGVKGNGKMYLLLIPKKLNHRPESIAGIDFNKVIVYDVCEHIAWPETKSFSNSAGPGPADSRRWPELIIGDGVDNNLPSGYKIEGEKAWASGDYYFCAIYENSTYKVTIFKYLDIPIQY